MQLSSTGIVHSKTLHTALQTSGARGKNGQVLHHLMPAVEDQYISSKWPALKDFLSEAFLTHTRDEWEHIFLNTDSCVAPVLEPAEAQNQQGSCIPKPAPHLDRTSAIVSPTAISAQVVMPGGDTVSVLREIGLSQKEMDALHASGDIDILSKGNGRSSKL